MHQLCSSDMVLTDAIGSSLRILCQVLGCSWLKLIMMLRDPQALRRSWRGLTSGANPGSPVQGQVKAPPAPAWLRMLRRRDMRCAGDRRSIDLRLWALLACIPSCTCAAVALVLTVLSPGAPQCAQETTEAPQLSRTGHKLHGGKV